nr:crotonase [Zoogloeaceae bacterium]
GLDKLALPVKSSPGFLVNAVLAPYMLEALRCVDEGVPPETVDAALLAFGMPMGPIELVDTVGLDIAVAAGAALGGEAQADVPRALMSRFEAGQLGKKTGQGFYRWEKGKPVRAQASGAAVEVDGLAARIVAPLVAAAQRLVAAGVIADADLADAGIIFGTGYAPFTGGPLHAHAGASAGRYDENGLAGGGQKMEATIHGGTADDRIGSRLG